MEEKFLEFVISGCVFTGEEDITVDKLNEEFIKFCEAKGWLFCGYVTPLEFDDKE